MTNLVSDGGNHEGTECDDDDVSDLESENNGENEATVTSELHAQEYNRGRLSI